MHSRWNLLLLTGSQAFLAGALPAPRFPGQSWRPDPDCDEQGKGPNWNGVLTGSVPYSGAHAISPTYDSFPSNSYPNSDPFTSPSATWNPQSDGAVSTSADSPPFSSGTAGDDNSVTSDPPTVSTDLPADGGGEGTSSNYTSAITFTDPHLSIQTVTISAVPSSQVPTTTSPTQNTPDTSGVRDNPCRFVSLTC